MMHSIGDAATDACLDAIEQAQVANPPWDRRPCITHAFLADSKTVARFRRCNVTLNAQAQWAIPDALHLNTIRARLGDPRWRRYYPTKSFVDGGVTVSIGADGIASGSIVIYRPIQALEQAHTRRRFGSPDGDFAPEASQCLSLPEILYGYTLAGAYQTRMEHVVGSLEVGKLADLIVLDMNVFDALPHEIHKARVLLTMMNGRVTHDAL